MKLTESDVRLLFECLFGGPVPENESLEDAAKAIAFVVGRERVTETLNKCKGKPQ